ncbi:helix-turn-helix transcriptional regulator [Radiobacillus kanasensis]|uniref:helix-turn-helix domain-containing protein n=1 Tax=Radiobacillus kanasensis TaxID=2844358 RepID=UPI001E627FA3|nr:helix-turn-helix transcriptional regulator [Radiobacillus kanasensis]UFU00172.1 helix-turn-helix transcriptional regulator [Radiobacillus kanasensis]
MEKKNRTIQQFGRTIRDYRRKKNISQEKLAELSGLHRTYISEVERGERNISLLNIVKIAVALEINVYELFLFIDKED